MGYVWAHLDIIKDILGCLGRDTESPTIPRYSVMRVFGVDIGSKLAKIGRVRISTHETDAGNVAAEPGNELIQHFCRQWSTHILPKELAVTPRTVARAITDINCQCHLVGYLLENDACINVL
jgi:hypothetical protein